MTLAGLITSLPLPTLLTFALLLPSAGCSQVANIATETAEARGLNRDLQNVFKNRLDERVQHGPDSQGQLLEVRFDVSG